MDYTRFFFFAVTSNTFFAVSNLYIIFNTEVDSSLLLTQLTIVVISFPAIRCQIASGDDHHGGEDTHNEHHEDGPNNSAKDTWTILGACIAVNVVTLVGVLLYFTGYKASGESRTPALHLTLNSFASGALLACAFFLMGTESQHLIADGFQLLEESQHFAVFGTACLGGFLAPLALKVFSGLTGFRFASYLPMFRDEKTNADIHAEIELQQSEVNLKNISPPISGHGSSEDETLWAVRNRS
jgi:hypothetical protein